MKKNWFFTSNVFRLLAERSIQRFFKFCYLFMEGLKSNPGDTFFDERYQQLLPYFTAFNTAYIAKFGNKAQRKGNTLTLHQLFKQLSSSKAHAWDVAIQNVYLKSTAKYINILPQGLSSLYALPIEQSILYLENAVIMSDNDPLLLTVHFQKQTESILPYWVLMHTILNTTSTMLLVTSKQNVT